MIDFINKYAPNKSEDLIGHFKIINDLKIHLKNDKFDKIILCIGYSGIGKTTLLKLIFKELNYDYKELIGISYKEEIDNYLNNKTITDFFKKTKKLLFIDDLDTFSNEKNFLTYLNNLDKNINIPIVCIINKLYNRKFNELKKISEVFNINKPTFSNCYKYIINILNKENIDITDILIDNIKIFIKKSNNNIKSILLNLNNLIDNKNYNNLIEYSFNNSDLFDTVNNLYNTKYEITDFDNIIYNDISLICMLLHENLIEQYKKKTKNINVDIIKEYDIIIDNICLSDIIENNIFTNNNWDLYSILYIIKLFSINNNIAKYKNDNTFTKNNFTKILTKYSLRYNYKKKKYNYLENLNISDNYYDNITQNLVYYINNNNIENIKDEYKIINKDFTEIINKYNTNIIDKSINKLKIKN